MTPIDDDMLTFDAQCEADTARLGHALAEVLPDGSVVALCGTLGAGKTRLVQAVAEASGVDRRDVVSPTFVLVHEYEGTRPIYHLDAYRLAGAAELEQLGASEYFGGANLVFVEWADRVESCLPDERLEITIDVLDGDGRRFRLRARGPRYIELIAQLRTRL